MKFATIYILMSTGSALLFVEQIWPRFSRFDKKQCTAFLDILYVAHSCNELMGLEIGNRAQMQYLRNMNTAFAFISRNMNVPMSMDTMMVSCSIYNWRCQLANYTIPYVPHIMSTCALYDFMLKKVPKSICRAIFSFVFDTGIDDAEIIDTSKLCSEMNELANLDKMLLLADDKKMPADTIMEQYFETYGHRLPPDECVQLENAMCTHGDVDVPNLLNDHGNIQWGIESLCSSLNAFGFDPKL